ncbi:Uncharacterised protein [Serratia grimesii]|nr:Uncharacterised protein [Serratia grimesii]
MFPTDAVVDDAEAQSLLNLGNEEATMPGEARRCFVGVAGGCYV